MSLLKNMKIRSKLVVGFALLLAMVIVASVFGAMQLAQVRDRYSYVLQFPTARYATLRDIEVSLMESRRMMKLASAYSNEVPEIRDIELALQQTEITRMRTLLVGYFQSFRASINNDPTLTLSDENFQLANLQNLETAVFRYIDVYIAAVMNYARAGDSQATLGVIRNGGTTINQAYTHFYNLFNFLNDYMDTVDQEMYAQAITSRNILIAVAAAAVILGIIIAALILSAVTKPINGLIHLVEDVVRGNLNVNMNHSRLTKDEVGVLTKDIYHLIDVIKNIDVDINEFVKIYGDMGDFEYRIDESKYNGAYKEIVKSIGRVVDSCEGESWVMMNFLDDLGHGNFDINIKRFPGKRVVINESIDRFMAHLNNVTHNIDLMIEAAADKGDLEFHIDVKGFEGGWLKILNGLNHIAEAVDAPIIEIRDVMAEVAQGKFDKKIEGNYNGDFLMIKNSINTTMGVLSGYIQEISKVLSDFANGDLTRKIERDYVGEFSAIKMAMNNITDILHKAMSEITMASKYVYDGATRITENAMELADGSTSQAASLEELHSTVDLIKKQTEKFSENAMEANELSGKSTQNAQEGNNAMKQMLQAMMQIKESSNNISKIIKTIQDIAFQTNLLALNASVEAARAGEHGRGFSVVADEVRSLAGRSQAAAADTTSLISESISRVETGTSIAHTTSASLDTIVSSAGDVMGLIG
ncbi:MAG: methyl-accepting chemotaxis protein, partial [Defluviitaleaceae bacterium]|nr:methyl-accepting chemotaxis protein [Defluviitaleaceae bacterium]